jgi:hypothetical protein
MYRFRVLGFFLKGFGFSRVEHVKGFEGFLDFYGLGF